LNDLLDGTLFSPSAQTVCSKADRLRRPHERFARAQNDFAVGLNDLPGSRTISPSASG
jgi:hypothetical protein